MRYGTKELRLRRLAREAAADGDLALAIALHRQRAALLEQHGYPGQAGKVRSFANTLEALRQQRLRPKEERHV